MLINVIIAGLLAMNFWEPLATLFQQTAPGAAFWVDSFLLLTLFAVFLMILRTATDYISRQPIAFPKWVDLGGGFLASAITGFIVYCFLGTAIATAPLPPAENSTSSDLKLMWPSFVQRLSLGTLQGFTASDDPYGEHVFDPKAEFVFKHTERQKLYASPDSVKAGLGGVMIIIQQ